MGQPVSAFLGELRAIAQALCENENTKKRMIEDLRAICKYTGETTDHVALIELATAQELQALQLQYCTDEDIKKRVKNYHQVLRYTKPTEATFEAANTSSSIKKATPKELHNVMLALCEDEDAKKRVATHLRVLRRSKADGAATTGSGPDALINSATEMELRAISLAMSDADEDVKKQLLESLHVLSIFGELQVTETKKDTFMCTRCKQPFHEKDNEAQSCTYHPGRVEEGMIPEYDLLRPVDRWSCCFRPRLTGGCKTQRHQRW